MTAHAVTPVARLIQAVVAKSQNHLVDVSPLVVVDVSPLANHPVDVSPPDVALHHVALHLHVVAKSLPHVALLQAVVAKLLHPADVTMAVTADARKHVAARFVSFLPS